MSIKPIHWKPSRFNKNPPGRSNIEGLEGRTFLSSGAGALDPMFGQLGTLKLNFTGVSVNDVAVQSDGKVLLAGTMGAGSQSDFFLARLKVDGSIDTSFGTKGVVRTDFNGGFDAADALSLQGDGKIIVVGASPLGFAIARYTTAGKLDASFSGDGKKTASFGNSRAHAVTTQSNGRIVVAGQCSGGMAVLRLTTGGNLDTSFNGTGKKIVGAGTSSAAAVAIAPDGKVVLGGTGKPTNGQEGIMFGLPSGAVVRLTSAGVLDSTFATSSLGPLDPNTGQRVPGTPGVLLFDLGQETATVAGLAVQTNKQIVVDGSFNDDPEFYAARISANGNDLAEFEFNGLPSFNDHGHDLALQPDGSVIGVGSMNGEELDLASDFSIVRWGPDGKRDKTFGTTNVVRTDFGGDESANRIALGPNNTFVVLGHVEIGDQGDVTESFDALARYNGGNRPFQAPFSIAPSGDLNVIGSDGNDRIHFKPDFYDSLVVNGEVYGVDLIDSRNVNVDAREGNDTVELRGAHPGTIHGGRGNDTILLDGSGTAVFGDDGNDLISGNGFANGTVFHGGNGNDIISTGDATESLYGDAGNDLLDGGGGADLLQGGSGNDTADYSHRATNLSVSLDNKANDGASGEHDNVMADVENIWGGSGNDKLVGNPFANVLKGNGGNDALWGGRGNDTLDGGGGRDQLFGQDDNDLLLAKDGRTDSLDGGNGFNSAQRDNSSTIKDSVLNIESFI